MSYFPELVSHIKNKIKPESDLSNYETKSDIEKETAIDRSKFAKKDDLASLETDVDKLGIGKLKVAPDNLNKSESKVNKTDVDELKMFQLTLKKLSDIVNNSCYWIG